MSDILITVSSQVEKALQDLKRLEAQINSLASKTQQAYSRNRIADGIINAGDVSKVERQLRGIEGLFAKYSERAKKYGWSGALMTEKQRSDLFKWADNLDSRLSRVGSGFQRQIKGIEEAFSRYTDRASRFGWAGAFMTERQRDNLFRWAEDFESRLVRVGSNFGQSISRAVQSVNLPRFMAPTPLAQPIFGGNRNTINNLQGAFRQLGLQIQDTSGNLSTFKSILASIGLVGIGHAVLNLASSFTQMTLEIERNVVLMGALEGNVGVASERIDQLIEISGRAPFSLKAIQDAFVKLKVAGIEPIIDDQGNGPLSLLLDAVAAFGGSEMLLHRAALAFQQMGGKGVASMEEVRQQLGEAVPYALKMAAFGFREFGKTGLDTVGELTDAISKGRVAATDFADAFFKGAERFKGFAEFMSLTTLSGAIQRVKSEFAELSSVMVRGGGLDIFIVILQKIVQEFDKFNKKLAESKNIEKFSDNVLKAFDQMIPSIAAVIDLIAGVWEGFTGIAEAAITLVGGIPAEVAAGGIIGYLAWGRVGAGIGILIAQNSEAFAIVSAAFALTIKTIGSISGSIGLPLKDIATGGIIGFLIFGKKGALVGAAIGTVNTIHRSVKVVTESLWTLVQQTAAGITVLFDAAIGKVPWGKFFDEWDKRSREIGSRNRANQEAIDKSNREFLASIGGASSDALGVNGPSSTEDKLRDFREVLAENIAEIRRLRTEWINAFGGAAFDPELSTPFTGNNRESRAAERALERLNDIGLRVKDTMTQLAADMAKITGEDSFKRIELDVTAKYSSQAKSLRDMLDDLEKMRGHDEARRILIDQINAALAMQQQVIARTIQHETEQLRLARERFLLESQYDLSSSISELQLLKLETNPFGEWQRRAIELKQTLADLERDFSDRIRSIEDEMRLLGTEGEDAIYRERLQAQIDGLVNLRQSYKDFYEWQASEEGRRAKASAELWTSVFDSIQRGTENAIYNLIRGTGTMKDAILAMYDEMIKASIRYIMQLVMMWMWQQLLGFFPGLGGAKAPMHIGPGKMPGFANGGVFDGPRFANGGLVSGPTLFNMGLMGEAGPEAIMPLERIGGKLGVRATGGGGDNFTINIRAVDAKGVAELFAKHGKEIIATARAQALLNNGLGRVGLMR